METTRLAMTFMVLVLALAAAQPARADYEAGQSAWDAGRTDEAVAQWQAATDAGDRRAMLALGRLYLQGLGVIQDYVEAHKWLNLAASRGEAAALKERAALAAKMTSAQIATAQARAAAWRPGTSQADGARESTDAQATAATAAAPAPAGVATSDSDAGPPPPRAIREAQTLLGALGYRPGPADGVWGRRTGTAYQAFLRDSGLPASETLTPQALHAMRAVAGRGDVGTETGRGTTAATDAAQAPAETTAPRPAPVPPDALHRAAQTGDIEGLKAALEAGVDIDARDGHGWTALMHAVNKGYLLLVEPLLATEADPNVRAPDGATALFMAAVHGHTDIIVMLMKAGASVSVRGPKGKTAVEVARTRYGEPDVARANGEAPELLALLDGRTWAAVQEEARRQADAAAWARAERLDTAGAYAQYANANPQGRYVGEARRREKALQEKAERAARLAHKWPRGRKLRDCEVCPEMVVVPAGKYRMGSPSHESGRDDDEGPVHDVTIWEPFAVGVYEVTREEFGHFVEETGRSTPKKCWTYKSGEWKERSGRSWKKPGFKQDERHPVVCVDWDDAKAYVGWLSRKTGERYRLLSESEWEYAARAGTRTSRHWGAGEAGQCRYANGTDKKLKKRYSKWKWAIASCDDKHVHTSPVGTYQPNGFGLHDVSGNVWEWVEDCWHKSYEGAPSDGSAWTRGGDCSKRVLRGGSWDNLPGNLRSANRNWNSTASRHVLFGFRVARTLTP